MPFGILIVPRIQDRVLRMNVWSPKMINLLKHPAGPFTIHFWCPWVKWGITFANLKDLSIPAQNISTPQQIAISITGLIWTRYCWVITPRNYNLMLVNFSMGLSGLYQLSRKVFGSSSPPPPEKK